MYVVTSLPYRCFVCQNDRKSNEKLRKIDLCRPKRTGTFRPPFKYKIRNTYLLLRTNTSSKTDLVPKCSEWAQSIGSSFLTFKSRFVTVYSIFFSPVIMEEKAIPHWPVSYHHHHCQKLSLSHVYTQSIYQVQWDQQ